MLEFFLDLYLELADELLPQDKSLNRWQRGLLKALAVFVSLIIATAIIVGALVVAENTILGIILIAVGVALIVAQIVVYYYLDKRQNSLKHTISSILNTLKGYENTTGEHIDLIAATKTRSVEEINKAIDCGIKIVGENRAQEFRDKFPLIDKRAEQHFIGHLQSNKIKYVVGKASLIHSCNSVQLAREVSAHAKKLGIIQDMLIEVNIAEEDAKHGFLPSEVLSAVEELKNIENVRFTGLMCVLPHIPQENLPPYCKKMRELYLKLKKEVFGQQFKHLSMGMSEDYRIAIENGANMVRLGRVIFGERKTPTPNVNNEDGDVPAQK